MAQYPVAQVVGGQQGGVVGVVSQPSDVNLDIGGRVERMQNELDVPEQIVRDLLSVAGADIVVIADDSGSMGAVANYVTRSTRWTESGAVWKPNVGRPTPATRRRPRGCSSSMACRFHAIDARLLPFLRLLDGVQVDEVLRE